MIHRWISLLVTFICAAMVSAVVTSLLYSKKNAVAICEEVDA